MDKDKNGLAFGRCAAGYFGKDDRFTCAGWALQEH